MSKHNCFELYTFLAQVPSNKYAGVASIKRTASLLIAFKKVIEVYSDVFKQLQTEGEDGIKVARDEYKKTVDEKKLTPPELEIEGQKLTDRCYAKNTELIKKGEEHELVEGKKKVTFKINDEDLVHLKNTFETQAVHFSMWQSPEKLAQIAEMVEAL